MASSLTKVVGLSVLLVVGGTAAPARARPRTQLAQAGGSREEARALYDEALRHYNVAEYDQAIEGFKAAYLITGDASLLFNVAQSYRLKGDCDEAARFYKNFMRSQPENKADAESAMNRCEAHPRPERAPVLEPGPERRMTLPPLPSPLPVATPAPVVPAPAAAAPAAAAPAPATPPPTAPPPSDTPKPRDRPATTPEPIKAAEEPRPVAEKKPVRLAARDVDVEPTVERTRPVDRRVPSRRDDNAGMRTGGVVMMIGGAAIAGTGVFFGLRAANQSRQLENYRGEWGPAQQSAESAGHRDNRIGQVLTAVGAGSAVAGLVLYIVGVVDRPEASHVALSAGPGGAGMTWSCAY